MSRTRIAVAAVMALLMVTWAGVAYVASPPKGMEKYKAYRVSEKDEYFARPEDRKSLGGGAVMVTFLGTTTLLFDDGKTQFLIDGFLTRPKLWRAARVKTEPKTVDEALEKAGVDNNKLKAVFVSQSHYDHSMDVAYIVNGSPSAVLYGSSSTQKIGRGEKVPDDRNRVFHVDQKIVVGGTAAAGDDHFVVTVLDSKHSPHMPFAGDIEKCVSQPAWNWKYKEGGSYDFLVRHVTHNGTHTILVRAGSNLLPPRDDRDDKEAEVLFLGTGRLGKEDEDFRKRYFEATVARLNPRLVIPIHWDNFFERLTPNLTFPKRFADNSPLVLDSLIAQTDLLNSRLPRDRAPVQFRILQGYESVVLFRPK